MLHGPHLATVLDSYLDLGSPFHALYQVFLQISQLWSLSQGPVHNPRTQVLNSVKRNVEASLLTTLYQLRILEFLEDLDRYLMELYHVSINSSASASSSPLNPHELALWNELKATGLVEIVLYLFLLPIPATMKSAINAIVLIISSFIVTSINVLYALDGLLVIWWLAAPLLMIWSLKW